MGVYEPTFVQQPPRNEICFLFAGDPYCFHMNKRQPFSITNDFMMHQKRSRRTCASIAVDEYDSAEVLHYDDQLDV